MNISIVVNSPAIETLNITCNDIFSQLNLLNFSQLDFPTEISNLSYWDYIKIIACSLTILVIFIGNSSVVVAVLFNRSLRSTINYYLTNLAIADILIGAFCIWVHLINSITEPLFVLGPFICKINGFVQMTCLTSSVLTLSAISCDRFFAIWFPLRSRVTKQRTGLIIISIWMVSMIVSIPFLLYRKYYELQWKNFVETNCIESWPVSYDVDLNRRACIASDLSKKFYYSLVTVTLFFMPVLVMAISYSLIVWKLWVHKSPGETISQQQKARTGSKKKIVKMVFVVLVVFVISWMPLQVLVLYSLFVHNAHDYGELPPWFSTLSYMFTFMAYFNSALNPLIYGGFNHKFRQALYSHVKCHFEINHQNSRTN